MADSLRESAQEMLLVMAHDESTVQERVRAMVAVQEALSELDPIVEAREIITGALAGRLDREKSKEWLKRNGGAK